MNSVNPKQQLKDVASSVENKLVDSLSELSGFKLVTSLVLEFKKINNDDKAISNTFYLKSKGKMVIMKVTLMMHSNQSI